MPPKVRGLRFGPAGIPNSAPKKDTLTGLETVKELGLDAMELEFVYGVRMKESLAKEAGEFSKENNIVLTAHAPYYINLNAQEEKKIERSIEMIVSSAKILYLAGGYSVVFHPGFYMKKPKEQVYKRVRDALSRVVKIVQDHGYDVWIRPETMEMLTKFGDLDEVIRLSQELEQVLPCIDFAHLRYRFGWNSEKYFGQILEKVEKELGKEALKEMHIHISGILMDKRGTHTNLKESDLKWEEILKLLKEFGVKGVVISESPNLEEDALLMKNYYKKLK